MVDQRQQQQELPAHVAELAIWRRGVAEPVQFQVSTDDANAFISKIREEGIDPAETYPLETQIDVTGRRMFVSFVGVEGVLARISTGIVPARGSSLMS